MNVKFIRTWIAALRSGEFTQGIGAHRQFDGSYCALGVAYRLREDQVWAESPMLKMFIAGSGGIVPDEVRTDTGLSFEDLYRIVNLNDHEEKSFAQIADHLERMLPPDWNALASSAAVSELVS